MLGKTVVQRRYFHVSLLPDLEPLDRQRVAQAIELTQLKAADEFHVVRMDAAHEEIALLSYPGFFDELFPSLSASWRVHLPTRSVYFRDYSRSLNPPILHRKELMLSASDPHREKLQLVTQLAESLGLFDDPVRIGFRSQWNELIAAKGYSVVGLDLLPIGNLTEVSVDMALLQFPEHGRINRHLTALTRSYLSAPVQALLRYGLLNPSVTFFDYGCGKGNDMEGLGALGITTRGWDPHFRAGSALEPSTVVNLGFVINVIESLSERISALKGAYALTEGVLATSAMLWTSTTAKGRPFGDGYLTSRSTFQKYFGQGELQTFIESVLEEQAIPIGPGIFLVFKDRYLEQKFLTGKHIDPTRASRLLVRHAQGSHSPRRRAQERVAATGSPEQLSVLEGIWYRTLALGRPPEAEECRESEDATRLFGTWNRAIRLALQDADSSLLTLAADARSKELGVFFALQAFSRRRAFRSFEPTLQRDIKAFFGSLSAAQAEGFQLLRQCADVDVIHSACKRASECGLGWLDGDHSLQLHSTLVSRLDPVLQVYVGCATTIYGDVQSADLVKIHIGSGKLSLMKFDDFPGLLLPRLRERVKVKLREQDLDIFEYGGEHPEPYLYFKSRYINEEFPGYPEQRQFDLELESLGLPVSEGRGPLPEALNAWLGSRRLEIAGARLLPSTSIPALDEPCGAHYTYRQLCECGVTWERVRPTNVPKMAETYNALYALATEVIDPVIDYFGAIELTYGFASPTLTRHISGKIAPELDQHASCELNSRGRAVCVRGGAAVDFLVKDEDMQEVARWISANCDFSRIYLYARDRPLHVSVDAKNKGEVFEMNLHNGRQIPRRLRWQNSR